MDFIDLAAQYRALKQPIDKRIEHVLTTGQYILGSEVADFEAQLADYVGVKSCVSCANGTDALQLALMALGIKSDHAVFVPTFTFFASAEVISLVGATPVFVDVCPDTFNVCTDSLQAAIEAVHQEGKLVPKAVIAVDLFGLPANYPQLQKICEQHNLHLIEDSAQGMGGEINSKKAGSFGDISTTSFFPAKPLGCYGDGGAVFSKDSSIAELLRSLRVHGKGKDKYDNVRIGLNSRLDTLQAAILLEKLAVFSLERQRREQIARVYTAELSEVVDTPYIPAGYTSGWAQYTVKVEHREKLQAHLKALGVPSMVYYQTCMHQQTAFAQTNNYVEFSSAEKLTGQVLSLPMSPYLTEQDQQKVISAIKSFY